MHVLTCFCHSLPDEIVNMRDHPWTTVHTVRGTWLNKMPLFRVYGRKRHSWSQGASFAPWWPLPHSPSCRVPSEVFWPWSLWSHHKALYLLPAVDGEPDPALYPGWGKQLWWVLAWWVGSGWGSFRQIILNCQKDLPDCTAINSTLFSSKAHWTRSRGDGSRYSRSSPWECV